MLCTPCQALNGASLMDHKQKAHSKIEFIYIEGEQKVTIVIERDTSYKLSCPFNCGNAYESRSGLDKHLKKANQNCKRPKYTECFSRMIIEDSPDKIEFPHPRSFKEALATAIGSDKTAKEIRVASNIIQSLDLVPFGISLHSGRELNAIAAPNVVESLLLDYSGEQVLFSAKDDDDNNNVLDAPIKMPRNHFHLDFEFSSTVLTGPFTGLFSRKRYIELNDEMCEKLNYCWNEHPHMKYYAASLFTGAVLLRADNGNSIAINTTEAYGRTSFVDDHGERNNESLPPNSVDTHYPNVWPITIASADGSKLVIGTQSCNILVTGSINLRGKAKPELGPSTNSLTLMNEYESRNTKIYIDESVYEHCTEIANNSSTDCISPSNSLYQLRQLRSQFHKPSTYMKLRYHSQHLKTLQHLPVTVFTLGNFNKPRPKNADKDDMTVSDGQLASRLFMEVATSVLQSGLDAKLAKDKVLALLLQCDTSSKERRVPKELKSILELFGENAAIRVLYNNNLNSILTKLADILSPYLTRANADVCNDIDELYKALSK